jgi:hypothetical protein
MTALSTVRSRYHAIARRLGAEKRHVWFATTPTGFGDPHVEKHGDTFVYIVSERGHEIERRETQDADELLYWLVSDMTFGIATEYELANRREGVDSRRTWFAKHVELLNTARPEWGEAKRAEYDAVLRAHPYSDFPPG